MREAVGDLWEYHADGAWVGITTNGVTNAKGFAVMGRGVAKQAAQRFPGLAKALGERLESDGNHVYVFDALRLFTFPVKDSWEQAAQPELIMRSALELVALIHKRWGTTPPPIVLPRPGCGSGRLTWAHVRPLVAALPDEITIIDRAPRTA